MSSSSSETVLSDIISLPKPPQRKGGSKQAVCISEDYVLEEMKDKRRGRAPLESNKAQRKAEREQKRIGRKKQRLEETGRATRLRRTDPSVKTFGCS